MFSIWMWPGWLLVMAVGYFLGARYGFLAAFMLLAVFYDWTSRKIPNRLVLAGAATAVLCQTLLPDGVGFLSCLAGLGLGLAALLPLYLLRTMGAGDVKLMAMVGAFLGSAQILGAVLGTLLAGFFLALVFAFKAQAIKRLLHNLRIIFIGSYIQFASNKLPLADETYVSVGKMPYALAIALGTFGYLSLPLANQLLR